MGKNRNMRLSVMRLIILLLLNIPLLVLAQTEETTPENTEEESYIQDYQDIQNYSDNEMVHKKKNISMTENANQTVNDMKQLAHYKYDPYGKLKKEKGISMDMDFSTPKIDISSYVIRFIIIITIVIFVIIAIIIFYCDLGSKKKKNKKYSNNEEDNIHNRNFNAELQNMLKERNYKEAIKIVYLETLYKLNDRKLINWELAKTPAEYYYEIKNKNIKTDIRSMTSIFLSVRYGNKEATEEMFQDITSLKDSILKISSQLTKR